MTVPYNFLRRGSVLWLMVFLDSFLLRSQLILFTNFITAKQFTKIYNYISDKCYVINSNRHFKIRGVILFAKVTKQLSNFSLFFFFFNRLCNSCGLCPAQLSLRILSRKVFTECRCQRHVKPPTWRTNDFERYNSRYRVSPASETTHANPSSGGWNYGQEISENFAESGDFHVTFGFFYMP